MAASALRTHLAMPAFSAFSSASVQRWLGRSRAGGESGGIQQHACLQQPQPEQEDRGGKTLSSADTVAAGRCRSCAARIITSACFGGRHTS